MGEELYTHPGISLYLSGTLVNSVNSLLCWHFSVCFVMSVFSPLQVHPCLTLLAAAAFEGLSQYQPTPGGVEPVKSPGLFPRWAGEELWEADRARTHKISSMDQTNRKQWSRCLMCDVLQVLVGRCRSVMQATATQRHARGKPVEWLIVAFFRANASMCCE